LRENLTACLYFILEKPAGTAFAEPRFFSFLQKIFTEFCKKRLRAANLIYIKSDRKK